MPDQDHCHQPLAGGSDPNIGVHPGADTIFSTADDVFGSSGVAHVDADGNPVDDPLFSFDVQVTPRAANTVIGSAYAPELFWDGRAPDTFVDPESGLPSVAAGGALETLAIVPILSEVEMAREGRTWDDVRGKLAGRLPLRDATDLPMDVAAALAVSPDYPSLFTAAFGDPAINAERIAYALASYQRTLVADQTPWDLDEMTSSQEQGWAIYQNADCRFCHLPPEFSDHSYRNIGVRPPDEDLGRMEVTGLMSDRGLFKVPTLRNVGLKATFEHTGRLSTVEEAVLWYRTGNPDISLDNLDTLLPIDLSSETFPAFVDFIANALTDPRVAAETFPFDRPTLHGGGLPQLSFQGDGATLTWPALAGVQRYNVYRGDIADLTNVGPDGLPVAGYGVCVSAADPDPTDTVFTDNTVPASGEGFFYLKSVIDSTGAERGLGATGEGLARFVLASCP